MKKTYVSGPMAGRPENNFPLFKRVTQWLRDQGREVVCPTECTAVGGESWSDYLRADLIAMLSCDHIILLQDFYKSRGATLEALIAWALGYTFSLAVEVDGVLTEEIYHPSAFGLVCCFIRAHKIA